MVYNVKAVLYFSTAARRDAVLADIQAFVADKPRVSNTVISAVTLDGRPAVVCSLLFVTKADATALQNRVETFATGQRTPTAGSYLMLHDCVFEDAGECTAVVVRRW